MAQDKMPPEQLAEAKPKSAARVVTADTAATVTVATVTVAHSTNNPSARSTLTKRRMEKSLESLTAGQARWAHYSKNKAEVDVKDEDDFAADEDSFDTKNLQEDKEQALKLSVRRPSGKYGESEDMEALEGNSTTSTISTVPALRISVDQSLSLGATTLIDPAATATDDDNDDDHDNHNDDDDDDDVEEPPMEQESGSARSLQEHHRNQTNISSIPEKCPSRLLTILPFSIRDRLDTDRANDYNNDDNDTIVTGYSQETLQIRNTTNNNADLDGMSVVTGHSTQTELITNPATGNNRHLSMTPTVNSTFSNSGESTATPIIPSNRRRQAVMLLPVDAQGTAISEDSLKEQWRQTGKCVECGMTRTHIKVKHGPFKLFRKMEPRTVEGRVYKGYCLLCHDPSELRQLLKDDTIPLDLPRADPSDNPSLRNVTHGVYQDGLAQSNKTKQSPLGVICSSWKVQLCLVFTLVLLLGAGVGIAILLSIGPKPFISPPPTASPSVSPSTSVPSMTPTSIEWVLVGEIVEDLESFGYLLSAGIDGNRIAVASPRVNNGRGQVDVYDLLTNESTVADGIQQWRRRGSSLLGDAEFDQMGMGMHLCRDGTALAIGYPGNENGFVRVFRFVRDQWVQVGQTLFGPSTNSSFGFSVALDDTGTFLVVGAPQHHNSDSLQVGYAQVYKFTGFEWEPWGSAFTSINDKSRYGHAVSLNSRGDVVLIGAPEDDRRWENGGNIDAWVFNNKTGWVEIVVDGIWGLYKSSRLGRKVKVTPLGDAFVSAEDSREKQGRFVRVVGLDSEFGTSSDTGFGLEGVEPGLELGIDVDIDFRAFTTVASSRNKNGETGIVRTFTFTLAAEWIQMSNDIGGLALGNQSWLNFGPSVVMISWDRIAVGYESVIIDGESKSLVRFFQNMGA